MDQPDIDIFKNPVYELHHADTLGRAVRLRMIGHSIEKYYLIAADGSLFKMIQGHVCGLNVVESCIRSL